MNIKSSDISATVKAAFNFGVDKFPLSGPDGMRTPEYGLFRDDTAEYVASRAVRKGYTPIDRDWETIIEDIKKAS